VKVCFLARPLDKGLGQSSGNGDDEVLQKQVVHRFKVSVPGCCAEKGYLKSHSLGDSGKEGTSTNHSEPKHRDAQETRQKGEGLPNRRPDDYIEEANKSPGRGSIWVRKFIWVPWIMNTNLKGGGEGKESMRPGEFLQKPAHHEKGFIRHRKPGAGGKASPSRMSLINLKKLS